eukprot:Lithocolla_globosa_v1_NODE_4941_length_1334_cov_98.795152.p2 type:complete len:101 gc:universal NODE_4941_length_1334_cov_98.795152:672-974(+)
MGFLQKPHCPLNSESAPPVSSKSLLRVLNKLFNSCLRWLEGCVIPCNWFITLSKSSEIVLVSSCCFGAGAVGFAFAAEDSSAKRSSTLLPPLEPPELAPV